MHHGVCIIWDLNTRDSHTICYYSTGMPASVGVYYLGFKYTRDSHTICYYSTGMPASVWIMGIIWDLNTRGIATQYAIIALGCLPQYGSWGVYYLGFKYKRYVATQYAIIALGCLPQWVCIIWDLNTRDSHTICYYSTGMPASVWIMGCVLFGT